MNINLHIERLVLNGVSLGPGQGPRVQAAVETELSRLLAADGLGPSLASGARLPSVPGGRIKLASSNDPAHLGTEVAHAVHNGLSK